MDEMLGMEKYFRFGLNYILHSSEKTEFIVYKSL